jgi:sporulation protein YlmC with PRC-barrel domain
MNKTVKILTVVSIFTLFLFGSSAFAQGSGRAFAREFPEATVGVNYHPTGEFPEITGGNYHPLASSTFDARWLIGQMVYTPIDGTPLGQISNLVIDNTNERVALVVLSDVQGLGAEDLAIPYSSLIRTGREYFTLSLGSRTADLGVTGGEQHMYWDPYAAYLASAPSGSELYGIPSAMDTTWLSSIYSRYGQVPYWTQKGERTPTQMELYVSDKLMGAEVRMPKGEDVAHIDDLIIDSTSGRIPFIILSNVRGRGNDFVAVPFNTLTRVKENFFVLNATSEKLEAAPSFNKYADYSNPKWARSVYRFFEKGPYRTEQQTW